MTLNSNRTLLYNMSQAKAKIIQFRVTEQDYANLMPISHTQPRRSTNEWIIKRLLSRCKRQCSEWLEGGVNRVCQKLIGNVELKYSRPQQTPRHHSVRSLRDLTYQKAQSGRRSMTLRRRINSQKNLCRVTIKT